MAFPINAKQILIHVSIFIEDEIQTGSITSKYACTFCPGFWLGLFLQYVRDVAGIEVYL